MNKATVPGNATLEPAIAPSKDNLKSMLGRSYAALEETLGALQAIHPEIAPEWRYSPRAGWYQIWILRERRIFYLLPERGTFHVNMLLGGKAIAALSAGPYAAPVKQLLRTAKRYPEGTAFTFAADRFDPAFAVAAVEAKLGA